MFFALILLYYLWLGKVSCAHNNVLNLDRVYELGFEMCEGLLGEPRQPVDAVKQPSKEARKQGNFSSEFENCRC
jgi:hypothetical protein